MKLVNKKEIAHTFVSLAKELAFTSSANFTETNLYCVKKHIHMQELICLMKFKTNLHIKWGGK